MFQVEVEFFRSKDPSKNDKFDYIFNQVEESVPQLNTGDNTENVDLPDLDVPYQASEEIIASNEEEVEEETSTETNEDQNDVEEPEKDLPIMNEELQTSQYETDCNLIYSH